MNGKGRERIKNQDYIPSGGGVMQNCTIQVGEDNWYNIIPGNFMPQTEMEAPERGRV